MKKWQARTKAPTKNDLYYLRSDKGGYNKFTSYNMFENGGNCTSYAYGRFMEVGSIKAKGIIQKTCKLPLNNAEDWFSSCKDYEKGQTPKHGAVACWSQGKKWLGADGAGHVAIVENFDKNYIYVTESGYKSVLWRTAKYPIVNGKPFILGYTFEGFIYNPWEENNWVSDFEEYKATVVATSGLNYRKDAGEKKEKLGAYNFGEMVTVTEEKDGWAKTEKGWVTLKYLKKIV